MYYFILPNTCLRNIPRNGSTALAASILATFYPAAAKTTGSGAYGKPLPPQNKIPSSPVAKGTPYALIRDPIERFLSAYAMLASQATPQQYKGTLDAFLAELPKRATDAIFTPQVQLIGAEDKLYKFPDHLNDLATALGLPTPVDPANASDPTSKPALTDAQRGILAVFYATDAALFAAITPGVLAYEVTTYKPMLDALRADKQAAIGDKLRADLLAVFNGWSPGDQYDFGGVRDALDEDLKKGDLARAIEGIQTFRPADTTCAPHRAQILGILTAAAARFGALSAATTAAQITAV